MATEIKKTVTVAAAVAKPVEAVVPSAAIATVTNHEDALNTALGKVESHDSGKPEEGQGGGLPYVGFFGAQAKPNTREPLLLAGIPVGEFYLHHIEPIRVNPFTFHLLKFTRLFTKQNRAMEIISAKLTATQKDFDDEYREHLFCSVAVRLPNKASGLPTFVPAVLALRGGQVQALGKAIALLPYAENAAGWAARSEKHAESAVARFPGGRFICAISSELKKTETCPEGFNLGHGNVCPTPKAEAEAFNSWISSAWPTVAHVLKINEERVAEAKKVLVS